MMRKEEAREELAVAVAGRRKERVVDQKSVKYGRILRNDILDK
jgi:hypothetical protein